MHRISVTKKHPHLLFLGEEKVRKGEEEYHLSLTSSPPLYRGEEGEEVRKVSEVVRRGSPEERHRDIQKAAEAKA